MRFKIEWATLLFGSKFTVLPLFYFVFEGNFPSTRFILYYEMIFTIYIVYTDEIHMKI